MEPERRAVATLWDLKQLGFNLYVVVLVVICVLMAVSAGAWIYITYTNNEEYRRTQLQEQRAYNTQMIALVTNIQNDLEADQRETALFNDRIMNIVDRHTQQIDTMWALFKVLEWIPMEVQKNGNILFQPPSVRNDIYKNKTETGERLR